MQRNVIHTDKAPQAIGTYSQAVQTGSTVYLSGQIPLRFASTHSTLSGSFGSPSGSFLFLWPWLEFPSCRRGMGGLRALGLVAQGTS